ncbi:MAG TPA: gliding motility-associated C-terminal domain-containing protein, partial [Chitinophagales bacterium]|nr:gliding motility-associated C-terminal domain-containing protein [Chitinophagales bacterium]
TCATTSFIIGSAAVAGNTYAWSPSLGLSNAGIAQPTATAPGTFTVTVTNTANGCTASDAVIISQNITPPVANAGADKTLTCATTSFIIGSAAVAGNTYAWSPSLGLSNAGIAQPTATSPGTYIVTVTNTTNGCAANDAVTISQNITPPTANAGADQILTCSTTSFVIGSTTVAGNTYAWSPSLGLSNAGIAQPTATSPGTYTVTVTNTANGCTANDAVTITRTVILPTANAGADQTLTCTTISFVIGSAAIAGNTYSWSPSLGLSNAGIDQPTVTAPGTYTVTVTNTANGCVNTDAVTISQNITPPTANAGIDKTLTCATTSFVIGTAAVAGNTYAWSPSLGLSNAGIAQPTSTAPGTYTLTVTNTANGCTSSDAVTISQNITPPTANAGADKTLTCATTSFVIGSPTVAGNTYAWSPSLGLSNAGIAQPTATSPGTYTVTVTNTANGCTANDAVTISQNITPPIANAGADQTLTCTTTSIVIGTATIAGNTYAWSPSLGLSNVGIAQPTATALGTYTVTVTNTANGCTANDAVTILQDVSLPIANAGADKVITCSNPTHVIGSAAIAGNTYAWSPSIGLSANNIAQPIVSSPGTYTVTVTKISDGCTLTDAVTITQNTTAPPVNAGTDQTLTCTNTSFEIGTTAVVGNSYSWSPTLGLSNANIAQPTTTAPNTYTLTVTNILNGCTSTDAVNILQNITPPTANAGADKIITCSNPTHVIGTPAIAGNMYSWSPNIGLSNASIAQPTANTTGNYKLTVTQLSNGCTSTDAVLISVDTTRPLANAGADIILTCSNPTKLIGTTAIAGNTYTWSPSAGLNNANIPQPIASNTGIYTVTVTKLSNGCTKSDAVISTRDTSYPVANAGIDQILTCVKTSSIIGTSGVGGNTYSWSPSLGLNNASIAQPRADSTGTFTLTVTKTSNGCQTTDAIIITRDTVLPIADAGDSATFGCPHIPLVLGTSAVPGFSYLWTNVNGISATNVAQPTTDTAGTYVLIVTNDFNGCISKPDTVITFWKNCECEFLVPSAFSPNNDGINDALRPLRFCDDYSDLEFSVFNRWGALVYKSNDIIEGWNGFLRSEEQQVDSYIWTLSYYDILHKEKIFKKGTVTLLR